MATRKVPRNADDSSPSTAVAVKAKAALPANIADIQKALAEQAARMNERTVQATGNAIQITQDKKFLMPDGTKTPGPIELVIVDFRATQNYYPNAFDKDNIVPPDCAASGTNPKKLVPWDEVPDKQAEECNSCPWFQWKSAPNGVGKMCKSGRRMAVLPPDATEDTPLWFLSASPTAIKGFDAYVNSLANSYELPPVGFVTTVGFDDGVTYASLTFGNPQPNSNLAVAVARQAEAGKLLDTPPSFEREEKPVAAPVSRKGPPPARKTAQRAAAR